MQRTGLSSIVLAVVIVVSMVVGCVLAVNVTGNGDSGGAAVVVPTPSASAAGTTLPAVASDTQDARPGVAASSAALADLPALFEEVSPSVVQIRARGQNGGSVGSGVVIDRSGHILTNYHVVQGAIMLVVELPDGTTAGAELVGSDPGNDLAVILADLPAAALVPVTFGDSDAVRVGESVFAIGNPFDLDFTVTSGIISGIDRESQQRLNGRSIRGVLQTDAAVNPGNSGGPLFNSSGEVIGINSAIYNNNQEPDGSPSRVFVGIGLAIPINMAMRFLPELIAGEEIVHTQLGIAGITLSALNAADAKVDIERGVYVTGVGADSAADRAGLIPSDRNDGGFLFAGGDVITAIDGVEVTSIEELARIIDDHDVGDEVALSVFRDGQTIELVATLLAWNG